MAGHRLSPRYIVVAFVLLSLFYVYSPLTFTEIPQYGRSHHPTLLKSTFDWSSIPPQNPVEAITPIPKANPKPLPRIQYVFARSSASVQADVESRRHAVRKTFEKSWKNYRRYAWKRDELAPISGTGKDTTGGWAATLISSLDTLSIMGFDKEYDEAIKAVVSHDWAASHSSGCNMSDMSVRQLGGLLAAYELRPQASILEKAVELGDMLYAGFDTPSRMPPAWVEFEHAKQGLLINSESQPAASVGSFPLEFTRLAQLTGDPKYYDAAIKISAAFVRHQMSTKLPGMWPEYINMRDETFQDNSFTLGQRAGIIYDYLPKIHALLGGIDPIYENIYKAAAKQIEKHLIFKPKAPNAPNVLLPGKITVVNQVPQLNPELDHESCFAGGMFAFAGRLLGLDDHVQMGARLTRGCMWASKQFATGVLPARTSLMSCDTPGKCDREEAIGELWHRGDRRLPKGFYPSTDGSFDLSYHLRPEVISSLFVLYRITGDREYQDAAWDLFQSIQQATETKYGYAGLQNVHESKPTTKIDSMEPVWMAATLKYFYLIFSPPDVLSLDDYIFNAEGHPLKRPV